MRVEGKSVAIVVIKVRYLFDRNKRLVAGMLWLRWFIRKAGWDGNETYSIDRNGAKVAAG